MSASKNRVRDSMLHLRLHDWELQELHDRARKLGCSAAEVTRAQLFNRPLQTVVPCSDKPHPCNPQHKDMVDQYRDQRYRDELDYENTTGNSYGSDRAERSGEHHLWKENGGRLVTFAEWLRAHRR